MRYLHLLAVLIFTGCSFGIPANNWQYDSTNAFDAYTKDFLSGKDIIARNDLLRAVKHAKSSADLTQLAKVYLGECALNISVGIKDRCTKYKNIKDVAGSKELDAYYSFLLSDIQQKDIEYLPKRYVDFASHVNKKEFQEANDEVLEMDKITSVLLSSALLKENIDVKTVEKAISAASFYGYKKAVVFWLHKKQKLLGNTPEAKKTEKKILILKGK